MSTVDHVRSIFTVNETYTWLREPLLRRLPDGSLCCVFFTGGRGDGSLENVVAAIRSDDDGDHWSEVEVLVSLPDRSAWAPSMFVHRDRAHIFWFSSADRYRYRKVNHVLSTGPDGRSFTEDRVIDEDWVSERGVDIRHGTHLRDGRVLLPIAWTEPVRDCDLEKWVWSDSTIHLANFGGPVAVSNLFCVGVMEPNEDFTSFTRRGRICKETPGAETPGVPFFENAIAELPDGTISMLIRADTTNRLWKTDSGDGGRTWSEPYQTGIPNPGSKPRIINLPDGRIVLFHNPNEKDYADVKADTHKYRTPLEMWVSGDDMQSWYLKHTLVAAPKLAHYPDGFYDEAAQAIYLAYEDCRTIYFTKIALTVIDSDEGAAE
jgi:hypothetical protein